MQAVIAVVTVISVVLLTKIVEQHLTTTDGGLGVGCRLLQQLATDILFCNGFPLHKLVEFLQVLIAVEGQTDTLSPIAAGTSRLLIVAFKRFGDVVVDDEAHIRLINAHAKGDGGHDDVDFLHEEVILRLRAGDRVESCMIALCLDIVGTKHLSQVFNLFPRQTIDDATLA